MVFERKDIERLLMIEFDLARDGPEYKQRYAAKAALYTALLHMLADLCQTDITADKVGLAV